MQITSVTIWKILPLLGLDMSLNDVCVMAPAWFGVVATAFLALLTAECAGSWAAGTFAALVMSVIPAHIMRSVAGGYVTLSHSSHSHSHTLTLSHSQTLTLSHSHTRTLSHSHTLTLVGGRYDNESMAVSYTSDCYTSD